MAFMSGGDFKKKPLSIHCDIKVLSKSQCQRLSFHSFLFAVIPGRSIAYYDTIQSALEFVDECDSNPLIFVHKGSYLGEYLLVETNVSSRMHINRFIVFIRTYMWIILSIKSYRNKSSSNEY